MLLSKTISQRSSRRHIEFPLNTYVRLEIIPKIGWVELFKSIYVKFIG